MQYVYGDDTSLINAMKRVAGKKKKGFSQGSSDEKENDNEDERANTKLYHSIGTGSDQTQSSAMSGSAGEEIANENRLNSFLQAASQLIEDLMDEETVSAKRSHAKGRDTTGETILYAM
jgi:hypothetical protein